MQCYSELRINQTYWKHREETSTMLESEMAKFLKGDVLSVKQGRKAFGSKERNVYTAYG